MLSQKGMPLHPRHCIIVAVSAPPGNETRRRITGGAEFRGRDRLYKSIGHIWSDLFDAAAVIGKATSRIRKRRDLVNSPHA